MGYEMIGVKILGLACDGGGNNARLFKLLCFGKEPTEGQSWLDEDLVSFANLADPTRWIAMFHCTTHGIKNMQNALQSSSSESKCTKHFQIDGVSF